MIVSPAQAPFVNKTASVDTSALQGGIVLYVWGNGLMGHKNDDFCQKLGIESRYQYLQ